MFVAKSEGKTLAQLEDLSRNEISPRLRCGPSVARGFIHVAQFVARSEFPVKSLENESHSETRTTENALANGQHPSRAIQNDPNS